MKAQADTADHNNDITPKVIDIITTPTCVTSSRVTVFTFLLIPGWSLIVGKNKNIEKSGGRFNPFRLSFSEPKCAPGRHIIFVESIFQHSPEEIVHYSINGYYNCYG